MIRFANNKDFKILNELDVHIDLNELMKSIDNNKILVMYENNKFVGWLRYNLFWDNIPFMNMLYLLEEYRNKGYGKKLVDFWEKEMKKLGYKMLLTSTQDNEAAQHFYRKIGYVDCGSFTLPHEELELILFKEI